MSDLENFIKAIEETFPNMNHRTHWPLGGGQIGAYFDSDEALDIYDRIQKLKQTKTVKEIAELMPPADMIRIFLLNNGIIGLKVAKKLGIRDLSFQEIEDYIQFWFDILKYKIKTDIFCLDGKNFYYDQDTVNKILEKTKWESPSEEIKKQIGKLVAMGNNLCYTLFFDIFMTGGFIIHGPYNSSLKFGKDTIMLVREYHNLNPKEVWPEFKIPYKKLKVIGIYKNLDLKMNLTNHQITKQTIGDKLIAYKIYLDGKAITKKQIQKLIDLFSNKALEQSARVRSLSNLDKVRQGAKIAFYFFKELREKMGDPWVPKNCMEQVIEKFGPEFIRKFNYKDKEIPNLEHWKKLFDPRNIYF